MDMSSAAALACSTCRAPLLAEDRYCEQCGARVSQAPAEEPQAEGASHPRGAPAEDSTRVSAAPGEGPRSEGGCQACGAPADAIDADRYCSRCGVRQRSPEDRQEIDLVVVAGVSDRGRAHRGNEDAFYLSTAGEQGVAVVVCDGISSSVSPDIAARAAADAAGGVLAEALRSDPGPPTEAATQQAICAAQEAVLEVPWARQPDLDAPSCTLVSATCHDGELVIGWVGDSRAYWIAGESSRLLTTDDSWAQEQVAAGLLSAEETSLDPRAHSITRWLGADAPEEAPNLVTIRPDEPGRLVLCSDGLWNYAPSAADIAALIEALPPEASALTVARSLTDTALAKGGHDNITVAVVNVQPPRKDGT
jgi:serine/threonine protein phosphatase PrpC